MADRDFLRGHKTADIDTTLPFQNVKAAVQMFGEKGNGTKTSKLREKQGAIEVEVGQLQEELSKARAHIVDLQKGKSSALSDLQALRKLLANQAVNFDGIRQVSLSCTDVRHAGLELELDSAKKQQTIVLAELEAARKEMSKLEGELDVALKDRVNAVRQAEEALSVAEVNAKRVEELSREISGTKESLALVKMACVEANKEREALLVARRFEVSEQNCSLTCTHSLATSNKQLDHQFRADLTKEDLRTARDNLIAAREALANIDKLKMGCGSSVTDATISTELEKVKSELTKAISSDALLHSTLKELQDKFKETKLELGAAKSNLKSRETHASLEVGLLTAELDRVRNELKSAVSCNEAFVGSLQKLQDMAGLGYEAKQAKEAMTFTGNDEAKAHLQAILKEAVGQEQLHHMHKRVTKKDGLETLPHYNDVLLSKNETLGASQASTEKSFVNALNARMTGSLDKEEHKKKKAGLPLFSAFLSRSKRKGRKAMSPTQQVA